MSPKERRKIVSQLRCRECNEAPSPEEIDEMLANFGHKLVRGETYVRICRPCDVKAKPS